MANVDLTDLDDELGVEEKSKKSTRSFLKRGKAAQELIQQAAAKQKVNSGNGLIRYRIPEKLLKQDLPIIFLDGDLDKDGYISAPAWNEHVVRVGNRFMDFPCIKDEEPCPACENGERTMLAFGLTVLDLHPFEFTEGERAGEVIEYSRRLFVCRRTTFEILQKYATQHNGLAGCVADVCRMTKKGAAVGEVFNIKKKVSLEKVVAKYGDAAKPFDYTNDLPYYTRAELEGLGYYGTEATGGKVDDDDVPF